MTGPRKPITPDRLMLGESLDGLYSYSALPGRTPDVAAAVRDQMLDDLLQTWDLRWYFLSAWEYPDCSRMDPPGHVMGFCAANEDQIVSGLSLSGLERWNADTRVDGDTGASTMAHR